MYQVPAIPLRVIYYLGTNDLSGVMLARVMVEPDGLVWLDEYHFYHWNNHAY